MARLFEVDVDAPGVSARTLPEVAFTRSGVAVRPGEQVWHWRDGPFQVHIDFARVTLPPPVPLFSLKYVENRSHEIIFILVMQHLNKLIIV